MFKIGDKIRIKPYLKDSETGIDSDKLIEYIGKTATITDVIDDGTTYILDIDNGTWFWSKDWFVQEPFSYGTCPRCGYSLIWSGDFSFEDYGIEGDGIVSHYICSNSNCHTNIEVYTSDEEY